MCDLLNTDPLSPRAQGEPKAQRFWTNGKTVRDARAENLAVIRAPTEALARAACARANIYSPTFYAECDSDGTTTIMDLLSGLSWGTWRYRRGAEDSLCRLNSAGPYRIIKKGHLFLVVEGSENRQSGIATPFLSGARTQCDQLNRDYINKKGFPYEAPQRTPLGTP